MENMKDEIEVFDSEDEVIIEPLNSEDLYDLRGNLITSADDKNTLPDNDELIQKAIDGDKQAFNELYMQSYRYVFFVVRQYIPDDETTYDVIQETFIKVYKSINRLRSPKAYYGWITIIAKNTARDFRRTARFETSLSYEEEDYSVFLKEDETQKDVALDVEKVLKKLAPEDADLLSLVYYDGMRISQIAKMQGVPATTVYSRFNKAKRNLKAQLNAHGIDKAIYSGNFISMITVAIRNIIGTALLSVAIAQQILDSIINGKGKKELAVAKIIREQQKKAILKIASVIVAISMVTSAVTALTLIDWARFKNSSDDFLTSTETEYYYETTSGDKASQNNNGGFWQNLFGGGNGSSNNSGGSSDNNSSNTSQDSSYYSNNSSITSSDKSHISNSDASKNDASNDILNDNRSPIVEDNTLVSLSDVLGNNPNNTTHSFVSMLSGVAKQGEWIYYTYNNYQIVKVKTDGTQKQVVYSVTEYDRDTIYSLNVIDDTLIFINGGICKINTDGTDFKRLNETFATNLIVKGNIGYFVDTIGTDDPLKGTYNLYQIDIVTGETSLLVPNAVGIGLKTIIDDSLIYVDGNTLYSRDIKSGSTKVLTTVFDSGIDGLLVDENRIFISEYGAENVIEIDVTNPSAIKNTYPFEHIYNYVYFGGDAFLTGDYWQRADGTQLLKLYNSLFDCYWSSAFDDGYLYNYNSNSGEFYRCKPDGTDITKY